MKGPLVGFHTQRVNLCSVYLSNYLSVPTNTALNKWYVIAKTENNSRVRRPCALNQSAASLCTTWKSSAVASTSKRKRKIEDENRQFLAQWETKYFMTERGDKMVCLICNATVAVKKEYNAKWHYQSSHSERYSQSTGQERSNRVELLKRNIEQQRMLMRRPTEANIKATGASLRVSHILMKHGMSVYIFQWQLNM